MYIILVTQPPQTTLLSKMSCEMNNNSGEIPEQTKQNRPLICMVAAFLKNVICLKWCKNISYIFVIRR